MTKLILTGAFLLLALSIFNPLGSAESAQSNSQWLEERYEEATSVKEGMTRADLIKIFRMDGGLQTMLPGRYVLKSCDMIKVDVEFDVPEEAKSKMIIPEDLRHETLPKDKYVYLPNEELRIKSISRPYLERDFAD